MTGNFAYVRVRTVGDAVEQLAAEGARVHAGGTDLLGCLRDGVFDAQAVVSIARVEELRGIEETADGTMRIGALTSVAAVAAHPQVRRRYPALAQGASVVASPQLRNQGTVGGNLCQKPRCWYYRGEFDCLRKGGDVCFAVDGENEYHCVLGGDGCYIVHPSDLAPALVALGASIEIAGPAGTRSVSAETFHVPPADDVRRETVLEPGEIVTAVTVPAPDPGLRSSYRKVRARGAWDFALAGVALALTMSGGRVERARVVLSGAAPVPWRSLTAEEALQGRELTEAVAAVAAREAVAEAAPLAKNAYKVPLLRGLIEEELLRLAAG